MSSGTLEHESQVRRRSARWVLHRASRGMAAVGFVALAAFVALAGSGAASVAVGGLVAGLCILLRRAWRPAG